jgi:hypothetical protein
MKILILSILLFFLTVNIVYAGISIKSDSMLMSKLEIIMTANDQKLTLAESSVPSQISLQTVTVPPETWVVAFGLCLILLGHMMKKDSADSESP